METLKFKLLEKRFVMTVKEICSILILIIKPTRCTNFWNLFLE